MRVDPSSIPSEVAPLAIASFTSTWLVTSAYPLSVCHLRPRNGIYSGARTIKCSSTSVYGYNPFSIRIRTVLPSHDCSPTGGVVFRLTFSSRMRFPVLTALVYFLYVHLSMRYQSYTHKELHLLKIQLHQRIFIHLANKIVKFNSTKLISVVRII